MFLDSRLISQSTVRLTWELLAVCCSESQKKAPWIRWRRTTWRLCSVQRWCGQSRRLNTICRQRSSSKANSLSSSSLIDNSSSKRSPRQASYNATVQMRIFTAVGEEPYILFCKYHFRRSPPSTLSRPVRNWYGPYQRSQVENYSSTQMQCSSFVYGVTQNKWL